MVGVIVSLSLAGAACNQDDPTIGAGASSPANTAPAPPVVTVRALQPTPGTFAFELPGKSRVGS